MSAPVAVALSDLARAKLQEYLSEEPSDTAVRLLVDNGKFGLSLDVKADDDVSFKTEEIPFVLEAVLAEDLTEIKIDYLDQGAGSGFSLDGPVPTSQAKVLRVEETPNPDARKFVLPFSLGREAKTFTSSCDPDAVESIRGVLSLAGVASVFQLNDFVTVTRDPGADWDELIVAVKEQLKTLEAPALTGGPETGFEPGSIEDQLAKFIATDVAPHLQADGGDIELVGHDAGSGLVHVKLVGACGTCPSSVATLRGGVERSLKTRFPEQVQGLVLAE